jgi:hypothetical protein
MFVLWPYSSLISCIFPFTSCWHSFKFVLRLSALVELQIQPLKGIFLPGHRYFPVQYQFPRTRQPLYFTLQTNYLVWDPHVILFLVSFLSLSLPSPHLPQHNSSLSHTDAPRHLLSSSSAASSSLLRRRPRSGDHAHAVGLLPRPSPRPWMSIMVGPRQCF